jgi:hypothetical protein
VSLFLTMESLRELAPQATPTVATTALAPIPASTPSRPPPPPPPTLPASPVQPSPVQQPSPPTSPVSSPGQLDRGSIEDEDGAYAPRVPLPEPAELGQPRSSERGTEMVEVKGGQSSEAFKSLLSPEKTLGFASPRFEKQDRQKPVVLQLRPPAKGAALEMATGG